IERLASSARTVVLSSRAALDDFHRFVPSSGTHTEVLQFCTYPKDDWFKQDAAAIRRKYNLPERYFIVCNQFWQHKNHLVVFKALNHLRERGIAPIVVCTGEL